MKKTLLLLVAAATTFTATAQSLYYTDSKNKDMARHTTRRKSCAKR